MEASNVKPSHNGKSSERGASLVEYALLVALIAIVAIVAVRTLGQTVSQQFTSVNEEVSGNP
jgi:pilus assembly protein Flp/PilA